MLSVANVRTAGGAANYFAADNYYTRADADRSGEWLGKGAQKLGLEGQVEARQFEAVLKGLLPEAWSKMLAELMEGEIARLDELLELAEPIQQERKIERLVDLIERELPAAEPVLLFTEYKATQALVVDALHARFGHGCCGFINGDERLEEINKADGSRGPCLPTPHRLQNLSRVRQRLRLPSSHRQRGLVRPSRAGLICSLGHGAESASLYRD